jgi:hypothetical protein
MKTFATLALILLTFTIRIQAGTSLIQTLENVDGKHTVDTNFIRLDKDKVRIDMGRRPETYMIYRGDKQVFWNVNLKDKTYMQMTEKDFEEMSAKLDDAMKKMRAQIQTMPPERRQMMEEMMAKMMPGGKAAKTTYKKVGDGGMVGRWATEKYEGTRDGAKVSEIWTAAPKSLDVSDADFQVLKDMAKFFEKFSKNMEGLIGDKRTNGMEGIPVKTVAFKDGKPGFESQIREVKKEGLAPELFEIPAGLTLKKMGQAP